MSTAWRRRLSVVSAEPSPKEKDESPKSSKRKCKKGMTGVELVCCNGYRHFRKHINELAWGDLDSLTRRSFDCVDGFEKELKDIDKITDNIYDASYKHNPKFRTGLLPCNSPKNRYCNILPVEVSMVRLKEAKHDGVDDYINANFVKYNQDECAVTMIATQGPLEGTVAQFWQMVWEQRSTNIVMLCEQRQCHSYFPVDETSALVDTPILSIENVKTELGKDCNSRQFKLCEKQTGDSRLVWHSEFHVWPDYGVPDTPELLRSVILDVHQRMGADDGPMVVHCGAGIGRTGCYMVAYIEMLRIWARTPTSPEHKFTVMDTLWLLRQQRSGMVQTKDQYRYCYEVVADEAEAHGLDDRCECNSSTPSNPKSSPPSVPVSPNEVEICARIESVEVKDQTPNIEVSEFWT